MHSNKVVRSQTLAVHAKTDLEQNGEHVSFLRWGEALDIAHSMLISKGLIYKFLKRSHKYA
jgi:hypothetical protein